MNRRRPPRPGAYRSTACVPPLARWLLQIPARELGTGAEAGLGEDAPDVAFHRALGGISAGGPTAAFVAATAGPRAPFLVGAGAAVAAIALTSAHRHAPGAWGNGCGRPWAMSMRSPVCGGAPGAARHVARRQPRQPRGQAV